MSALDESPLESPVPPKEIVPARRVQKKQRLRDYFAGLIRQRWRGYTDANGVRTGPEYLFPVAALSRQLASEDQEFESLGESPPVDLTGLTKENRRSRFL